MAIEDGRIVSVTDCASDGLPYLSPGLVDLQVNGYRDIDLNSEQPTPEQVEALCGALAQTGVAAFLPTVITASCEDICQRLSAIARACETLPLSGRMIAGIHVEGPAISAADGPRGAHPLEHVRPASCEEFTKWQEASGNRVRIVTLAPEQPGALEYIRTITAKGVIVAIGHSAADPEEIFNAAEAGATMSTHLGNGIAAMLPRHPNAIWAQLADDRLLVSFIADGHHLSAVTLKAMIRAKNAENSILVSDSVALAGMPPGRYRTPIGGAVEVSSDGRISIAGTPYLAGSGMCLSAILGRVPEMTGLSLAAALNMATVQPAALIGRACAVAPDMPADFILFDWSPERPQLALKEIILAGERIGP